MLNLAANVSMLFAEVDFRRRAGRNEPGTGEINFEFLFGHIDRLGYGGWIGCEYNPVGDTREGLEWARRYLL